MREEVNFTDIQRIKWCIKYIIKEQLAKRISDSEFKSLFEMIQQWAIDHNIKESSFSNR